MESNKETVKINTGKMLLIFIGELFVLINLRIMGIDTLFGSPIGIADGFDLLPNFIGYILILVGCLNMAKYEKLFKTSAVITAVLILVSLFEEYRVSFFYEENDLLRNVSLAVLAVSTVLEIVRIIILLKAIDKMVNKCSVHTLLDKAMQRCKVYVMFSVIDFLLLAFTFAYPVIYTIEIIVAGGVIITHCLIAAYIMNAKGELNKLPYDVCAEA